MSCKANNSVFKQLDKLTSVSKDLERSYLTAKDRGAVAENQALNLVKNWFDVTEAWLARKGSVLDTGYKVDLVVVVKGATKAVGIQVKSSVVGEQEFLALRPTRQWEYGFPDVVVLDTPHRMVERLAAALGVQPKKRVVDATRLAAAYKGRIAPVGIRGVQDLVSLGFGVPTPGGVRVL